MTALQKGTTFFICNVFTVNGSLSNGKIMPTGMMNGNHRGMANGPGPAPWQSDPMSQDQMKAAQVS